MKHFEDLFTCVDDLISNFQISEDDLKGTRIHAAIYRNEDYSGSATVLFEKGKKLWLVEGSHCSCNGLENQWEPEETDWPTVLHFLDNGEVFREFSEETLKYLRRVARRRVKKAQQG